MTATNWQRNRIEIIHLVVNFIAEEMTFTLNRKFSKMVGNCTKDKHYEDEYGVDFGKSTQFHRNKIKVDFKNCR